MQGITSWNYRVFELSGTIGVSYNIFTVYYDNQGDILAHSSSPVSLASEDLSTLEFDLNKFKEALKKPVLKYINDKYEIVEYPIVNINDILDEDINESSEFWKTERVAGEEKGEV